MAKGGQDRYNRIFPDGDRGDRTYPLEKEGTREKVLYLRSLIAGATGGKGFRN